MSEKEHADDICKAWLDEERIITHEALTEDGIHYYCAHCDCEIHKSLEAQSE